MSKCIIEIEKHLELPQTSFYWISDQYGAKALVKSLQNSLIYRDIRTNFDKWEEDEIGFYKKGANLKSTGENAPREKRPYLFFPILFNTENHELLRISFENNPNHCNLRIPCENHEKHWNSGTWSENHGNHANIRIPFENHENHENPRISLENHENHYYSNVDPKRNVLQLAFG